MTHWKIILSYDGTGFNGWQVQPGLPTVQGTLAAAIHTVTTENVLPQGSGRTDAGVHALAQVATFSLAADIPSANLHRALNHALPASIRVLSADPVPNRFHARHSAISKTYEYRLFERRPSSSLEERICPPFLAPYAWDCRWPLISNALAAMNEAATHLLGTHDFASFAASDPDQTTRNTTPDEPANTIRTIHSAAWHYEADLAIFRIHGNGFLHHMVRNLVGTLVDVARGTLTSSDVARILAAKDRTAAGPTAPAHGLFLVSVDYGPTDPEISPKVIEC